MNATDLLLFVATVGTIGLHIYGRIGDLLMIITMCVIMLILVVNHIADVSTQNHRRE